MHCIQKAYLKLDLKGNVKVNSNLIQLLSPLTLPLQLSFLSNSKIPKHQTLELQVSIQKTSVSKEQTKRLLELKDYMVFYVLGKSSDLVQFNHTFMQALPTTLQSSCLFFQVVLLKHYQLL